MAEHPFPQLGFHPNSGAMANIEWAEYIPHIEGSSTASFGDDGVGLGMTIFVYWSKVNDAITALLGFSQRKVNPITGSLLGLSRQLPWQHPLYNQLFVKRITALRGVVNKGTNNVDLLIQPKNGGLGAGADVNLGPWSNYHLAEITLQFWRPPYYMRSDSDIVNSSTGLPQEWMRYVETSQTINTNFLSREGSYFKFANATGTLDQRGGFQGSVGQKITKLKRTMTWHQIPAQCLFTPAQDATPQGLPTNLLYMQTATVNPVTGYSQNPTATKPIPITGCVNAPLQGGFTNCTGRVVQGTNKVDNLVFTAGDALTNVHVGDCIVGPGICWGTQVLEVFNATTVLLTKNVNSGGFGRPLTFISDFQVNRRFFGYRMGTLLYEGVEIKSIPLQLPAYLMNIPFFAANQAIAQEQFNVVFHFEYFDPPIPSTEFLRGHNTYPYSGNGLWYAVRSQQDGNAGAVGKADVDVNNTSTTPFQYADLSDLFTVL